MKEKYYVIQKREDKPSYPLEDARKKAMELALKYPDDEFKILMEVCTTKVPKTIETWTDGMTIEELASLRTNPEWKDAPNNYEYQNGETSIAGEEYMKEGEQWFRLMKAGEEIPQYAQYRFNGNPIWYQTVLSGAAVDLNHGRSYRVKCDPPHGEVSIGGEEYMKEGEQWFRLLKFGDVIPKHSQCKDNSETKWRESRMAGEHLYVQKNTYRVKCDPPHGAFRGTLKPA